MPHRRIRAYYKQLSEFERGRIIGLKETVSWPYFQRENARPHTARVAMNCFTAYQKFPLPTSSPDLSPIEVSAVDKGIYPLDPDAEALYSGCTQGKRRTWVLPDDRPTASLVGLLGGWRHARMKIVSLIWTQKLVNPQLSQTYAQAVKPSAISTTNYYHYYYSQSKHNKHNLSPFTISETYKFCQSDANCQVIYSQFGLAIHQNDHQARHRFVEWAQNEIAVVPDIHKRILFSDEGHFWLNGYVNKRNCRIWSEANPQVYVETPLHPEILTVWCALWAGGNIFIISLKRT
ncbi:hypothetical protein TNCV_1820361 [Trichonephila clavipes]|nr:hypothetical protein TNCV_1820361 [Trichonephila clavipes]